MYVNLIEMLILQNINNKDAFTICFIIRNRLNELILALFNWLFLNLIFIKHNEIRNSFFI